nr:hypothetical protein [Tanacetum cinerariifolium]
MEGESRASHMAWTQSMDVSDVARSGVIALCTQVAAQRTKIIDLRATNSKFQTTILETARVPAQPEKMEPKRTTRANPATTTTTTTTSVTDAQLEALIEQDVARALAARDADRNTNGDDIHNSGTGVRRTERVTQNRIKFSTCTLLESALTWWNSHVTTIGPNAAYAMNWVDMKKKMTDKYCPRGEMKKLKSKL